MCRINRWHTRRQHIRNEHLLNHLQLLPIRSDRTAAAKAAIDARRSRRANARARYRPQPQRRRQISDDENPNHFVFGHGWLPKEGCKICIECRQRNDPVGLALDIAHNRARHYADEVLQAAGVPTSPGGRYLLPAGFPSPTP